MAKLSEEVIHAMQAFEKKLEDAKFWLERSKPNDLTHSSEFVKGYLFGAHSVLESIRFFSKINEAYPEIRREVTQEEKEKFKYSVKEKADPFTVAANELLGCKLEEGKEYEFKFPLVGILSYNGEDIPVYDDDFGQQDFCMYHGKSISGGAYNLFPESEFIAHIESIRMMEIVHGFEKLEGKEVNGNKD